MPVNTIPCERCAKTLGCQCPRDLMMELWDQPDTRTEEQRRKDAEAEDALIEQLEWPRDMRRDGGAQ